MSAHPAAVAAANWWAEQVGAPTFRNVDANSGPEDRVMGDMAGLMQSMLAERHPVTAESGAKFATLLADALTERLQRTSWGVQVGVDYGPDMVLAEPAEAAGVSLSRFPWKTRMTVQADYVVASLGYRAPLQIVWQSPTWVRPECGQHRYADAPDYEPTDDVCTLLKFHEGECGDWREDKRECVTCGTGTFAEHYRRDGSGERFMSCYDFRVS